MPGTQDQHLGEREADLSDSVAKMSIDQTLQKSDLGSLPEVLEDLRITKSTDLLDGSSLVDADDKENETEHLNKVIFPNKKTVETKSQISKKDDDKPKSDPKTKIRILPKSEVVSKAKTGTLTPIQPKNEASPGIVSKTKARIQPKSEANTGTESKTKARTLTKSEATQASPKIVPKPQSKSKTSVVTKNQIESASNGISKPQNVPKTQNQDDSEGQGNSRKEMSSKNATNKDFPKVQPKIKARTKTQTTVAFGLSTTPKEKKIPGTPKNLEILKQNGDRKSPVLLGQANPRSPNVSQGTLKQGQPASTASITNGQAKTPNVVKSQTGSKTPRRPVASQGGVSLNGHSKARTEATAITAQNQNEAKSVSKMASAKRQNVAKNGSGQKISVSQASVTSFFPVRRSERKPKQESEASQQKLIVDRLESDSDVGLGLEIRQVPEKGRGIFSTQVFNKGDFVIEYAGDLINVKMAKELEGEYSSMSKGCYMYYFRANDKQYCIDATKESGRWGRLINHSRLVPNLQTKVVMLKDKPRLILIAKRDIDIGEELLYDYGDRSKESLDAHPWLAM